MAGVGLVAHDDVLAHVCGHPDHPERPERVSAIRAHLEASGLADRLEAHQPSPAARELLADVHAPALLDELASFEEAGGAQIDADTGMGPGSLRAALLAAGGAAEAAGRVLDGSWDAAMVAMRPPGHHATRRRAMGFCLINSAAVAAAAALRAGAGRVVILDWDAHHGNGTQDIFWSDGRVLYVSLHQFPWYPGSGDVGERGEGDGSGTTLNVPLPAGTAEDAYALALDTVVEPAVAAFEPQLVVVSAGYDAHHRDPLCMMRLTAGAFHRMAARVSAWGPGPVCVLEGGYDLDALAWSAAATVAGLLGQDRPDGVPESELGSLDGAPEARAWVERAAGA